MKDADAAHLEAEYGNVGAGAWPPTPPRYTRRPWLAALLSILVPGLGHVYVGEIRRGLGLWSALVALFVLSGWIGVLDRFWGLAAVLVVALGLYAYTARDASSRARRLEPFQRRPYNRWWVYVAIVLFADTVVAPGVRLLVPIQAFVYPSGNMKPAVEPGDHVCARKGSFGTEDLARGDIVVYRSPGDAPVSRMHRIVALPGEEIDIVDKVVHIDGEPLDEPYARLAETQTYPDSPFAPAFYRQRDQFGPYRIPENAVFVMGDNRDRSHDSRFFGPVPIENVYARPLYVYWNQLLSWWRPDLSRIGKRID